MQIQQKNVATIAIDEGQKIVIMIYRIEQNAKTQTKTNQTPQASKTKNIGQNNVNILANKTSGKAKISKQTTGKGPIKSRQNNLNKETEQID